MCEKLIAANSGNVSHFKLKQCYSIVLFILVRSTLCISSQSCPKQISTVASNISQTVTWHAKDNNEIVFSEPPCVDVAEKFVFRACSNGSWIPAVPPQCQRTVQNNKNCPTFFKEMTNSCVYVSELKAWDTRCSLIEALDNDGPKKKYPLPLRDDVVWLPYRRKVEYGPYEWTTVGDKYGTVVETTSNLSYVEDTFNKNCMIGNTNRKSMKPEYCNSSHVHVCHFYSDYEYHICPENCISAGFATSKCYCKRNGQFCEHFANIDTPFDKNVLAGLLNKDECYISGNNGSNSIIPAHRQAISKRNWFYTVKHLNCSICSMRSINDSHNVEMLLTFERNQKRLHLQIYSPEGLLGLGQESFVYCFTDASKELKKRVKVEQKLYYGKENDNKERTYSVYKVELETYIGQYWCEAHKRSLIDELIQSNTVIAYKKKEGNEYSLRISVNNFCRHFNCKIPNTIPYNAFVNSLENTIFKNINAELRVMKIFSYDIYKLDVLIHISTKERKDIVKEYGHIKEELKKLPDDVKVDYLESSEFCLPEVTQLDYISLNWPLTSIKTSVVPEEVCLENNNLPIYRVCHGHFLYGAKWAKVHGNCQSQKNVSESTKFFQSAVNQNVSEQLIKNVTEVIGNNTDLSVLSIYYLKRILKHVSEVSQNDSTLIDCTIDMTSNLLNVQSKSLVEAQTCFNATDTILDAIEDILANPKFDSDVHLIKRRNIIVHVTNPFLSNVSGVVVSSTADGDLQVDDFKRDDNFENVSNNPHLNVAVYVPEAILEDIYEQNITNVYIVTTIYLNDRLFVSSSKEPAGPVVSVTIPHYGDYLPSSLPIIFKTDVTYKIVPECGFWDYGKNTRRKKGDWSKIGANYLGNINNDSSVHSCSFSHLTHFALLILDQDFSKDILDKNDDDFLTVITITGGSLTIIGVTCIFITAIVFEKWRRKQGTKILINLSIAILLETLTMHLTEIKGIVSSDLSCQIIGSITHYIVVSKFCWMLVYAFLQYMRFVKVLGILPENVVIKSAVFGWGFAIIPVVVVNLSSPYTYSLKDYHFCYPRGLSLYLGVLLPVVSIILINLVVFYVVMNHVSTKRIESHCSRTDSYKLQIKLATLLFFVLGIPWVFGVLAYLIRIHWLKTFLVYLFCTTCTVQGFILFLFYVLFNRETRLYWTSYFLSRESSSLAISSKT